MIIAIRAVPSTVPAMPKREVKKAASAAANPVARTVESLTRGCFSLRSTDDIADVRFSSCRSVSRVEGRAYRSHTLSLAKQNTLLHRSSQMPVVPRYRGCVCWILHPNVREDLTREGRIIR